MATVVHTAKFSYKDQPLSLQMGTGVVQIGDAGAWQVAAIFERMTQPAVWDQAGDCIFLYARSPTLRLEAKHGTPATTNMVIQVWQEPLRADVPDGAERLTGAALSWNRAGRVDTEIADVGRVRGEETGSAIAKNRSAGIKKLGEADELIFATTQEAKLKTSAYQPHADSHTHPTPSLAIDSSFAIDSHNSDHPLADYSSL